MILNKNIYFNVMTDTIYCMNFVIWGKKVQSTIASYKSWSYVGKLIPPETKLIPPALRNW